jgi:hypothetical protein
VEVKIMTIIKDIERKQVIFLLLVFMVGCLLAVSPVAAIHGVTVNLEQPGGPCTPADKCILFTIDKGMNQDINAFLVSFPDSEVTVPDTIDSQCVNISWNNTGVWTTPVHPNVDVQVFHGSVPGHTTPPGTTTIKIWTPVSIPSNKQVEICFLPCSGITLSGCDFIAWVSSDLEPYDPTKDSDFKSSNVEHPEYEITAIQSQGGIITPTGTITYECGETPTYTITADECYVICDVCVEAEEGSHDPCFDRQTEYIPGVGQYTYIDSKHATFTFDPLHGCGEITAKFAKDPSCFPVNVFLKYQNSLKNCGDILNVGNCTDPCLCQAIFSSQSISEAVNFTDSLYIGGNSSVFYLNSTDNALPDNPVPHSDYGLFTGGNWNDATPVGEPVNITVITFVETETFQAKVNLNDGSQVVTDPFVISGPGPYTLKLSNTQITNIVNVVNVVGTDAGPTCGYQDAFRIDSTLYDEHYGDYSGGQWNDDESLGEPVAVNITSLPFPNPETYLVTYVGDDATPYNSATLVILEDGSIWWAPQNNNIGPINIVDILNVTPQRPAWQLHTSCWIEDNPEFEGLIGALIVVDNGTYKESFEMDTPGVVLKSKHTGGAVIDAFGIKPAFNATEFPGGRAGAVFITAGCTEINGFVIQNAGHCNGGAPDIDGNGFLDTAGIVVHPSSWKCAGALIDGTFSCHDGRVNIINNTIWNSTAEGILANDTVVLVEGNDVYQNCWDGFAGEELHCGVECIDPFAITHCFDAVTEILYNKFHDNGCGKMSYWVGQDCKNMTRTSFSTAFIQNGGDPFWIDSGIEIRSVLCCRDNIDGKDGFVWNEEEPSLKFSDPFIIGNKIYNNTHAGINLLEGAVPEGNCDQKITIVENEIKGNGVFGISNFADEAKDHLIIQYNDISGNKWWGIKNFETDNENDTIIAKENWWGKIGGPSSGPAPICHEKDQRSIALGNGDAVSEFVEYNPWLTQPFCVVLNNDPVRWYGSDTLELDEGWNTLSVPLTLDDRADTILEISNLGWFLTPDNFVIAYQFNATSHLFEPINPYLTPCRGYYIKVKEHTRFPVLYSGSESPGLPSFALAPGWNLVGSAFGIDKKDNKIVPDEGRWAVANPDSFPRDPESFMSAEEALDSLMSISPRGLSTVISPSVPGQIKTWALTADELKKQDMYVGEGYWVFMVNPGTLSGFEITPFHFEYELALKNKFW